MLRLASSLQRVSRAPPRRYVEKYAGVVFADHEPFRSYKEKQPEGVSELAHAKYSTLYDILSDQMFFSYAKTNQRSLRRFDARRAMPCRLEFVERNFGAQWEEGLLAWFEASFAGTPDYEKKRTDLALQIRRLAFTRYTWREMAEGLTVGVDNIEDVDQHFLRLSLQWSAKHLKIVGEEAYKKKLDVEAVYLQWTEEDKANHLREVKEVAATLTPEVEKQAA